MVFDGLCCVEMRCNDIVLDSTHVVAADPYFACYFRGHVGAARKVESRDFHFAGYFAFTVVKWMARCCCHSSAAR